MLKRCAWLVAMVMAVEVEQAGKSKMLPLWEPLWLLGMD